jgi:hypothetical protein
MIRRNARHSQSPSTGFLSDDGIIRTGYYEYRIIARHYDGGFSQMSDIICITIN